MLRSEVDEWSDSRIFRLFSWYVSCDDRVLMEEDFFLTHRMDTSGSIEKIIVECDHVEISTDIDRETYLWSYFHDLILEEIEVIYMRYECLESSGRSEFCPFRCRESKRLLHDRLEEFWWESGGEKYESIPQYRREGIVGSIRCMRESDLPWQFLFYRYWTIWRIYGKYGFYAIWFGSFCLPDLESTPLESCLSLDGLIIQSRYR